MDIFFSDSLRHKIKLDKEPLNISVNIFKKIVRKHIEDIPFILPGIINIIVANYIMDDRERMIKHHIINRLLMKSIHHRHGVHKYILGVIYIYLTVMKKHSTGDALELITRWVISINNDSGIETVVLKEDKKKIDRYTKNVLEELPDSTCRKDWTNTRKIIKSDLFKNYLSGSDEELRESLYKFIECAIYVNNMDIFDEIANVLIKNSNIDNLISMVLHGITNITHIERQKWLEKFFNILKTYDPKSLDLYIKTTPIEKLMNWESIITKYIDISTYAFLLLSRPIILGVSEINYIITIGIKTIDPNKIILLLTEDKRKLSNVYLENIIKTYNNKKIWTPISRSYIMDKYFYVKLMSGSKTFSRLMKIKPIEIIRWYINHIWIRRNNEDLENNIKLIVKKIPLLTNKIQFYSADDRDVYHQTHPYTTEEFNDVLHKYQDDPFIFSLVPPKNDKDNIYVVSSTKLFDIKDYI